MSTLMRNIGILDARKATPEQIAGIGKMVNIGYIVVNPATKAELMKVSLLNVGKMLELDDDYRLHTGPLEITRNMLQEAPGPLKYCITGPLSLDCELTPELLQSKLAGLCLIGPASVPEHLHGVFMAIAKDIIGPVTTIPCDGTKVLGRVGKINLTNAYLEALEDGTKLSLAGNLTLAEDLDPELFVRKISSIKVMGGVTCDLSQEEMLRKVLAASEQTRVRIIRSDYHYVPGGTRLDAFTVMTVNKNTISCPGLLILDEEFTEDIIREQDVRFEAGTLYFPQNVMREMASRLFSGSHGIPYEPGKLTLVTSEQHITQARLESLPEGTLLLVNGVLEFDEDVSLETAAAKIAVLDNYGQITASRDLASILQGKLRRDQGSINSREEDEEEVPPAFDIVIENVATYSF